MFELPYRDLSLDPPDPAALDQIPQAFCWSRGVLPIGFQDNAVVVAIGDPHDIQTIDDLTMMTSAPVRIVVVAPSQLRQAIEQGYQTMDLIVESDDPSAGKSDLPRPSDDPRIGDVPNIDVSPDVDLSQGEGPVITFVNQLLRRAVDERASDLHLEPTREGLRVRFRVDGILHDVTDAPPSLQAGILSRVKIMTGMDIADHRRPQDGRVSMVAHGLSVDIRAASLPTIYGNSWFCDCSKRTRACWISPDWASRLMP
jgi:type IV pilus assembly protein PilB